MVNTLYMCKCDPDSLVWLYIESQPEIVYLARSESWVIYSCGSLVVRVVLLYTCACIYAVTDKKYLSTKYKWHWNRSVLQCKVHSQITIRNTN